MTMRIKPKSAWRIIYENAPYSMQMCSIDFVRKMREHSKLRQFLFRLICGKYAYREYELLILNMEMADFDPDFGYGLEDCNYHKRSYKELRDGWLKEKEELINKYG